MENQEQALKEIVRQKYAEIAGQDPALNAASCCGSGPVSTKVYNIMADDYSQFEGYASEANLGLGCGLPTQFAHIKKGDVVIDLGSGAGNDCFVARHETGAEGKVIGVDFTEEMIQRARTNAEKLGFHNVEFRQGDIEQMPVNDNVADVVVSNCVLNLVPNKRNVFKEIFRVTKPGGHFSISDIVLTGELPENLRQAAEMYAGCVSGAIMKDDYLSLAAQAGFENLTVQKQKPIVIPDDILEKYLSAGQIADFRTGVSGIESITLYAEKPTEIPFEISEAKATDFDEISALLQANGLPTEDLTPALGTFMIARLNKKLVGVAGLENLGQKALLRSVAIDQSQRNNGLANRLQEKLLAKAKQEGVEDVYLITTTAGQYFEKSGFSTIDRTEVPAEVQATAQFSNLCPSTAETLHKRIGKPRVQLGAAATSCCTPGGGCC
ncbi:arsenic resistance N-acetyltransferase ArsN2 [Arundinibacter roseus]|uniref:Arsenite methyltransferase n=1 Tax=Arundinibacter roseus TaxID=2070510 RepID=A0A4R4KR99_9BACT|nr:arsenic resistance N-acetyltransferase ArsN2 [Arundinibacter roseus]TDB69189.1 GNAT family N-acetyltransferase [Arundinibacter roseus]